MKDKLSTHIIAGQPTLFIIRGVAGAGKSTLAKQISQWFGADHYEADMFFMRDGEYQFDPQQLPAAHKWCLEQVTAALETGRHVVVANTFCVDAHIQPYIHMTPNHVIIQLNTSYGSIHNVPAHAITRMQENLSASEITPHYIL